MGQVTTTAWLSTRAAIQFSEVAQMGDLAFVSSTNTASAATGGSQPNAPALTLIQAQTLLAAAPYAGAGSVCYVASKHAETIVGAAGMTFSTPGIRYQGLGIGRLRPKITFSTSTAAQMIVSGANITFDNFVFDFTGIDAIVAAISVTGADVSFTNCDFICNNGTAGVVKGILTAATADRLIVNGCRFLGVATNTGTTTTAQLDHEVGVDYQIVNCYFTGKMTQAILNATTCLRGLIDNNRFVISTGTVAITMASASTPFITNNRINVPSGSAPIVAAAGFVAGNSYSSGAGVTAVAVTQ